MTAGGPVGAQVAVGDQVLMSAARTAAPAAGGDHAPGSTTDPVRSIGAARAGHHPPARAVPGASLPICRDGRKPGVDHATNIRTCGRKFADLCRAAVAVRKATPIPSFSERLQPSCAGAFASRGLRAPSGPGDAIRRPRLPTATFLGEVTPG